MYLKCLFFLWYVVNAELDGHLKPLGQQRPSEGHIEILDRIPSVEEFFQEYIKGSKPVVFKQMAHHIPAFKLWNDEYLKEKFGHIKVDIEEGKKENRSLGMWQWPFKKFLERYKEEDIYMVHSLPKQMRGDLRLFPFLSCGGYTHVLNDVIMWFSSGGTKSVLHNDLIDNVNCLFSGTKTLYMVDYRDKQYVNLDAPEGSFSLVNVDAVDLNEYPGLSHAPWWEAKMESGDCIFIPSKWFHQVRSFATEKRNMAVNIWFYNMRKINTTECIENESADFIPLDRYNFVIGGSSFRSAVKYLLSLELEHRSFNYKKMSEILQEHNGENIKKGYMNQVLRILDKDLDRKISIEDLEKLEEDDYKYLSYIFPGLQQDIPEEEDPEETPEGEDPEETPQDLEDDESMDEDVEKIQHENRKTEL